MPGELEEADPGQGVDDNPISCIEGGDNGGGGGSGGGGVYGQDGGTYFPLPLPYTPCPESTTCVETLEPGGTPPGVGYYTPPLDNPYYNDPSNDPGFGPYGPFQISEGGGGGGLSVKKIINTALKLPIWGNA